MPQNEGREFITDTTNILGTEMHQFCTYDANYCRRSYFLTQMTWTYLNLAILIWCTINTFKAYTTYICHTICPYNIWNFVFFGGTSLNEAVPTLCHASGWCQVLTFPSSSSTTMGHMIPRTPDWGSRSAPASGRLLEGHSCIAWVHVCFPSVVYEHYRLPLSLPGLLAWMADCPALLITYRIMVREQRSKLV